MNTENKDKRNFLLMLIFLGLVLISSVLIFNSVMKKESKLEETEPETFETPEQAYHKTKDILFNVSTKINKGIYSIEKINTAEKIKN
ncbi:hypothetical protein [Flavobacterium sp. I3-2]|uniref:hypothetical protein n=1 Tax=Flavobacterium sp. I3-2 TaxID=2748319 RepID=UPI0015AECEC6|nr:hypothetical protein [Flavobacterium sp. I3-2]